MSKQTVKVRAKLNKGSLRCAPPKAEKHKRVRLHFGDGNSMLVSPEFAAGWQAGYSRGTRKALVPPPHCAREMTTHDIGCWYVSFFLKGVLEPTDHRFVRRFQSRPSLLSRLKAWWPL